MPSSTEQPRAERYQLRDRKDVRSPKRHSRYLRRGLCVLNHDSMIPNGQSACAGAARSEDLDSDHATRIVGVGSIVQRLAQKRPGERFQFAGTD
jgi:hypothetical protein